MCECNHLASRSSDPMSMFSGFGFEFHPHPEIGLCLFFFGSKIIGYPFVALILNTKIEKLFSLQLGGIKRICPIEF